MEFAVGLTLVVMAILLAIAGIRASSSSARVHELRGQLAESDRSLSEERNRSANLTALRAASDMRADLLEKAAAEQRANWENASNQLQATFKALAADALNDSRAHLVAEAERLLGRMKQESDADLASSQKSLAELVAPLKEALGEYKRETAQLEEKRFTQLGKVDEQYRTLSDVASRLRDETAKLANALRTPHVRGRWGQMTLRRSAELAGMVDYCDFYEQETVPADGKRLRPDMLVRLPTQRLIVVDAKVPMNAYLDAMEATTDAEREAALTRHAEQTKDHVIQLAGKEYQQEFESSPEFVVAFIPSDSILAAAVERDPDLVEFALGKGVVLATPATFFALLRAVAFGWRQEQAAANAMKVNALGRQLAERLHILVGHLEKLGGSLARAVGDYNSTVSSLEARVLPAARRFRTYGVSAREIVELEQVGVEPRLPQLPSAIEAEDELFPEPEVDDQPDTDLTAEPRPTSLQ